MTIKTDIAQNKQGHEVLTDEDRELKSFLS